MQQKTWWIVASLVVVIGIGLSVFVVVGNPEVPFLSRFTLVPQEDLAFVPAGEPQPKAEVVDGPTFDFGYMQVGATRRHTFHIKNVGQGVLKLRKGETSCTCTVSELTKNELKPGEEALVALAWTPPDEDPVFRKTAQIFTNDRNARELELVITGSVARVLSITPDVLTLPTVKAGAETKAVCTVYTPAVDRFTITKVEFTDPATRQYFDVAITSGNLSTLETVKAKAGYDLEFTIKPGLPLGRFQQRVRIETDLADTGPIEINVQGIVVGDISLVGGDENWRPEAGVLSLGQVARTAGASRKMKLLLRGQEKERTNIACRVTPEDVLQVEIGPRDEYGKIAMVPLEVRVPAGTRTVSCTGLKSEPYGEVQFYSTDDPDRVLMRMFVSFSVVED